MDLLRIPSRLCSERDRQGEGQQVKRCDERERNVEVRAGRTAETCQYKQRYPQNGDLTSGATKEILCEKDNEWPEPKDPDHSWRMSLRLSCVGHDASGNEEIDHWYYDHEGHHPSYEDTMILREQEREGKQYQLGGAEEPILDRKPGGKAEAGQYRVLECKDGPYGDRDDKNQRGQRFAAQKREFTVYRWR